VKHALALTTSALSVLSLSAIGLIGSAPNATAADGECFIFCAYENDNFKGASWGPGGLDLPTFGDCMNVSSALNNKTSSMENPSAAKVLFYDAKNCTGTSGYTAKPDSSDKDLTNNGFDNKTSSVKFVRP